MIMQVHQPICIQGSQTLSEKITQMCQNVMSKWSVLVMLNPHQGKETASYFVV